MLVSTRCPRVGGRSFGLAERLSTYAADPYRPHNNVTALQGRFGYRLRVGDNRVIYTLNDGELVVLVVKAGSRGGIYK